MQCWGDLQRGAPASWRGELPRPGEGSCCNLERRGEAHEGEVSEGEASEREVGDEGRVMDLEGFFLAFEIIGVYL